MEDARFDEGEVPSVKCGDSHSLQAGRVMGEDEGGVGVVDGAVSDEVGVCVLSGVSDCLDSRTCMVDSGCDASGDDLCNVRSVDEGGVDEVCSGDVSRADHDEGGADVGKNVSGGVNAGSKHADMPFDDEDWISELLWDVADESADVEEEDTAVPDSPKASDKIEDGPDPSTPVKRTGDWTA